MAKTLIKPDYDRALVAWESFTDSILMDALDGTFDAEQYTLAAAAFSMTDHETMEKIASEAKRDPDFIEAPEVFDALDKPKTKDGKSEREWTVAERYAILRSTERTRAYARAKLDTLMKNDTPFS
jgi:hypothetical protein